MCAKVLKGGRRGGACVWVGVCVSVSVSVPLCLCVCACVRVPVCLCASLSLSLSLYVCVCVCMCMCVYVCVLWGVGGGMPMVGTASHVLHSNVLYNVCINTNVCLRVSVRVRLCGGEKGAPLSPWLALLHTFSVQKY